MEKIAWAVLTVVILVSALAAYRHEMALLVGRLALGVFYLFAGALVHVVYLASGETYADFADAAHFSFVRDTWATVVAQHHLFFIGLLAVFEAVVGLLILSGGRRAELGMVGVLAMQAGLLLFGGFLTVSALVMLVAVGFLLRAQRHHDRRLRLAAPRPVHV
jgi:hypothetical protein